MIDVLLQNLERGNGQNAASIPQIDIIPCMHIEMWPGSRAGQMLGVPKPKQFRDWVRLYMTDHTKGYSEKAVTTVQGRKYAYQVSGFYPGDSDELRKFLGITEWVKFVLRVRDTHGVTRIIGNNIYGLELDFDSVIEAEMGGKRGTQMTFSGELADSSAIQY